MPTLHAPQWGGHAPGPVFHVNYRWEAMLLQPDGRRRLSPERKPELNPKNRFSIALNIRVRFILKAP